MRVLCVGISVLAALWLTPREAHADDSEYGEEIALADGASFAVTYATARISRGGDITVGVGVGSYLLFAPGVHLLGHGQADRAALSFAMRLVPTTALLSIGTCGGGEEATSCVVGHLLITFFGGLAASTVDIFAVADGSSPEPMPLMLSGSF